ncbi:hypothetical protein BK654_07945 [Pseudomonas brassicacearum]|uniref:hypothetical protein n=1 Tax=Pseudomonas brassicacearum TaxID=930166 RepID=UPI000F4A0945|nr:hypothetical protein [Pseudomonas brassicacearum]ROM79290.1 hypothetical protein BK654_07945 [Pseudomonas brassicacearum]
MSDWIVSCHAEKNGTHFKSTATVIIHGFTFDTLYDSLGASLFSEIRAAAHRCNSPFGDSAPMDIICARKGVPIEGILYSPGADIPDYNFWELDEKWTQMDMNGLYGYPSMNRYLISQNQNNPSTLSDFFQRIVKPKPDENVYFYWLACKA